MPLSHDPSIQEVYDFITNKLMAHGKLMGIEEQQPTKLKQKRNRSFVVNWKDGSRDLVSIERV